MDGTPILRAVSCASLKLCVAVDDRGNALSSRDPFASSGTWSTAQLGHFGLNAVSCPSESLCVVSDNQGNVLTSTNPSGGASTWTATHVSPPAIDAISCPKVTLCVGVDFSGNVVTSTNPTGGASAWSSTYVDSAFKPGCGPHGEPCQASTLDVGCNSAPLCAVTDDDGNVITSTDPTGGSHAWTLAHVENQASPNSRPVIFSALCPSSTACLATDVFGNTITSTNPTGGAHAWQLTHVDHARPACGTPSGCGATALRLGSCPSVSFCVAFDSVGNALGSANAIARRPSWTSTPVEVGVDLTSISCPVVSRCLAVDGDGNALVGGPPPPAARSRTTLLRALAPSGKAARLAHVLSNNGYTFNFKAPSTGRLLISWYQVFHGTHHAHRTLVATSKTTTLLAGTSRITITLTHAGRQLLHHAHRVSLTADAKYTPSGGRTVTATKPFALNR